MGRTVAASVLLSVLLGALGCAVATRDPNRMVATAHRPIPSQPRFVVVQADGSEGEGLEIFQGFLTDTFTEKGYSAASSVAEADVALIYGFECLTDAPRSARAKEQTIGVTHLKLSIVSLGNDESLKRGVPFWSATGSTEDPGCNPTQSGVWLVPRMLEFLDKTVEPARALTN